MNEIKIARYSLLDIYGDLLNNNLFLKEAEETLPEFAKDIAKDPDDRDQDEFELVADVLREVQREGSLYSTYITSPYLDDWIGDDYSTRYYKRYQIFGIGGIYWIDYDNNESVTSQTYYLRYDDARHYIDDSMADACNDYLDHQDSYEEPEFDEIRGIEEYKQQHDLIIRPEGLTTDYKGAPAPLKNDESSCIRFAFHEHDFEFANWEIVEEFCKLQVVLSTSPQWSKQRLVIAFDEFRLPVNPKAITEELVRTVSEEMYVSNISIWGSGDHSTPLIDSSLLNDTRFGFEIRESLSDNPLINALRVYFLRLLNRALHSASGQLDYPDGLCDEELKGLKDKCSSVVIPRAVSAPKFTPLNAYDPVYSVDWYPEIFFASDSPLPEKNSSSYPSLIYSYLNACVKLCDIVSKTDTYLNIELMVNNKSFWRLSSLSNLFDARKKIEENIYQLAKSDFNCDITLRFNGFHKGLEIQLSCRLDPFRFELTGSPIDDIITLYAEIAASEISHQLRINVQKTRSDYILEKSKNIPEIFFNEVGLGHLGRYEAHYQIVHLDENPDSFFIDELAREVWRVLSNSGSISLHEAVHCVMHNAELAKRFTYTNKSSIHDRIIDRLHWKFCNPNEEIIVAENKQLNFTRKQTLLRIFSLR